MSLNFNQYAQEGNAFLKQYAKEIDLSEQPEKAGRILSSILHGLRSIISVEESLQFVAQLPMFLKAVYVNGWTYYIRLDIMLRDLELHKLTLNHEKKKQKLQSII